jgi:PHD/YefM family antitoxin component YafN of YafNO toxin-antitoxin module
MLHLTTEQLQAAQQGEAVAIEADGKAFVLLSRAAYEDDLDFSPWSQEEVELLADEAMHLVSDDDLNEDDA